jgi:glucose/arabinose dehydrogenase
MRSRRPLTSLWALAVTAIALCAAAPAAVADPALPPGFQDSIAFPNLEKPTAVRFAPNGMVFVAEKAGKIEVFENLDDETPELFKDLRTETYDHGDRGLLGLAIDPNFPAQPYVYALFTYDHVPGSGKPVPEWGTPNTTGDSCPLVPGNESDDCVVSGRLIRYTANVTTDGEGHRHAVASGEKVLIAEDWCQQFSSHSIGDLRFGPEGALYAGGGDGASFTSADYGQLGNPPNPCGDPEKEGGSLRSQDLRTLETGSDPTGLSGTIIRIDPSTGKGWPDNPLSAKASENEKRIVALGFRNPFRFALDPKTGEMYVGNVGSSEFEELDRFNPTAGLYNSGWPCYEGVNQQFQFKTFHLPICEGLYAEPQVVSSPLFYYSHKQFIAPGDECPYTSGSAIAGPAFYEGSEFPAKYKGALFFADSVRGCFYVMPPGGDGRPDPDKVEPFMTGGSLYPGVDIEEGPDGSLYYVSLFGEGFSNGAVHRITYAPNAPSAKLTVDTQYSPPAEIEHEFHLDASGSSDPTNEALTFEWDLDGNGSFEIKGGETKTVKYTEAKNVVVSVRVKDGEGLTNTAKLTLYPGDTPPVPTINSPTAGTEWAVGDTIHLSGSGKNAKNESLEPLFLAWSTRILHCPNLSEPTNCHSHPLQDFPGVLSADLIAPEHDYPSYLEITLSATDKRGLSASKTIKLPARKFVVHVDSSPSGIPLTAGPVSQGAPFEVPSVEGAQLVLNAPPTYELGGKTYTWQSWSDGGAISHTIIAKGPTSTYTAVYSTPGEEPPAGGGSSGGGGTGGGGTGGGGTGGGEGGGTTPPNTVLGKHPPKSTRSSVAKFTFSASSGGATFTCKLDGKAKAACRSPKTYKKLKPGKHTFKVWASAGGKTDATPAKFTWKVLPPKR